MAAVFVGQQTTPKWSREFLIRAVAYGIQAQAFGGLDAKTLQVLRKANGSTAPERRPKTTRLSKGSKLLREWHGETHEVLVLDKGFACRGETYSSLSAIARAITGAHWNGWAFFGVKRRQGGGGQWLRRAASRAPALRHLHPQVHRGGAGAGLQLPACPARGLRGLHPQPAP